MLHGHGDDLYRYGDKIKYNFSSNVYSDVDHSALMRHLAGMGKLLKSYPEPEAKSLEAKIAAMVGVKPEEVLVTNGATEAIYLIALSQHGRKTQIIAPAFREYQDACRIHGVDIEFIPEMSHISKEASSLWLCNPANPSGMVTDLILIKDALNEFTDKLFVIDQAYAAYSVKPVLSHRDAVDAGNVILLSSLTKDFAVPGLRIGYAVGNRVLLDRLRGLRMPWSVNAMAIEAADFLLDHRTDYRIDARLLHDEALQLATGFRKLGITVSSTDCNFILCKLPPAQGSEFSELALQPNLPPDVGLRGAALLKQHLIDLHGILIRDASNFEGLSPLHFRVAAQSPAANTLLLSALRSLIKIAKGHSENFI